MQFDASEIEKKSLTLAGWMVEMSVYNKSQQR